MDKRNKRIEATDKKTDYKAKDRGDLKKFCDKTLKKSEGNTQVNINVCYPERGDSGERQVSTNQKPEKIQLNSVLKKPTNEETKSKYLIQGITEREFPSKKNDDKEFLPKSHSELRKRIRDRYTIKLNNPVNKSDHLTLYKSKKEDGSKVSALKTDANKLGSVLRRPSAPVECPKKQLTEETTQTKEKLNRSSTTSNKTDFYNFDNKPENPVSCQVLPEKKPEKIPVKPDKMMAKLGWKVDINPAKKRKPMIKTIMSKTGSVRIFKAVTFVDQRNSTPLEIKIPGSTVKKQQKVSKFTETSPLKFKPKITVSKTSIKQEKMDPVRKKPERKRDRKFRHMQSRSPEYLLKEPLSPPTEVARWAPASIDAQTKPYYEAWVNTTLAAISKNSKKDKLLYEKQAADLLRCFHKVLEERPQSPELFYENFADEKYAGRIKIRQTDRVRKK